MNTPKQWWTLRKIEKRQREDIVTSIRSEQERCLAIMASESPNSEAYGKALVRLKNLREETNKLEQIEDRRLTRVCDTIATFAMAGITLTAEQWVPVTSNWRHSFMKKFHHDSGDDFYV